MTWAPVSRSGKLLWQLLPAIYRNWDGAFGKDPRHPEKALKQRGDLANYLDAYGMLIDQVRNTLLRRLEDTSPETCQDWLIPYFADLLDVKLVSPDTDGQRMEVARAVSWRQRKGTIGCSEEIAREVGRYEQTVPAPGENAGDPRSFQSVPSVVLQEGYRRVATTAHIGAPLPSLYSLGLPADAFTESASPIHSALRPGLRAGTVDFRYLSRSEAASAGTPLSQTHVFEGEGRRWQQVNPRGAPCFQDTYQDVSVRTVDVRTPGWNSGHYHPHRVLFYTAPRDGFFSPAQLVVDWNTLWGWFLLFDSSGIEFHEREDINNDRIQERELETIEFGGEAIVLIERLRTARDGSQSRERIVGVALSGVAPDMEYLSEQVGDDLRLLRTGFRITENTFDGTTHIGVHGFGDYTPRITTASAIELDNVLPAQRYAIEDFVLEGELKVSNAPADFSRTAIKKLTVNSPPAGGPVDITLPRDPWLVMRDSLVDELSVSGDGLCRLEYCTVLSSLGCKALEASDCLLMGANFPAFTELYLRYCSAPRLPETIDPAIGRVFEESSTRVPPLFLNNIFGQPGCAVLHPASNHSTRQGAEDGGEMGAYHHLRHVLREQAAVDKLKEFLPVTQEPVLITHGDWVTPVSTTP